MCLKEKIWDKKLDDDCKICGKYRSFSWCVGDFAKTDFDVKFVTPTPIKDFVQWLLKFWKKNPEKKKGS
jgi:hypothetical protein